MADENQAEEKLKKYMEAIRAALLASLTNATVKQELQGVLDQLRQGFPDRAREYLAIRGYLRFQKRPPPGRSGTIDQNWVWSAAQVRDYKKSPEYKTALAWIDKVKKEFKRLNREFTREEDYYLNANSDPRTLDEQTNNWLKVYNPSRKGNNEGPRKITEGSRDLMRKLLAEIKESKYDEDPAAGDNLTRFKEFLLSDNASPNPAPSWATPGLSAHGQVQAFDFVVILDTKEVAGTSTTAASIKNWTDNRWDSQLNKAIRNVDPGGKIFEGPLKQPNEPWHYFYHEPKGP